MRLTSLVTQKIGPLKWKLLRPLVFTHYRVPVDFVTNGTSCPRLLWSFCSPMSGPQVESAVLHDWLYSLKSGVDNITRKAADKIFYKEMIFADTPLYKAKVIYYAVRMFGKNNFKKEI